MTSNPAMAKPPNMPRSARWAVTLTGSALVAALGLLPALPAAPALASPVTHIVLVFGGTATEVQSASIQTSPAGATLTVPGQASANLFQDFEEVEQGNTSAAEKDASIYIVSGGEGTDTSLSSAIVDRFSISVPSGNQPEIATVHLAAQDIETTVCASANSCASAGLPAVQLASSANPATAGDTVTFTATEPTALDAGTPSGTVSFTADNAALAGCTNLTLASSQATCSTSSLPAGNDVISAQYSGDDNYVASTATLTQTVNPVSANTPPVLSLPSDQTAEATGPGGAVVTFTATATDATDGSLIPACSPASGSEFPLGSTEVSCSVTDSLGLTTSGSFMVTVVDDTPPSLTLPSNITAEATGPSGAAVSFTATATDLVDGSVPVICAPDSGSTFALDQTTTVICSASDSSGNTATGSFTVTVVDDTPPSLTLPSNITAEATGPAGAAVTYTASATDLVDGPVPVNCTPASGSTFPLDQTTTVTCSAADAHGNTATGSFTVTVVDDTPPSLTLPSNITAEATGPAGAAVTYTASATDLVDGPVPVNCTPASGSTFPVGTTTVSCAAADSHGNTATGTFTVTVTYAWAGFFQPVDNPPTVNTVNAGSAIPVQFSLAGDQGLNIFQSGYPASAAYTCSSTAPTDAIDQTVTAGNSGLSYDPTTDQYTYVWKTNKAWAGTCRALVVILADGTTHTADFQFSK